jgi:hypothetical protein
MPHFLTPRRLTLLVACAALGGCASTRPLPYAGLASASQLRAEPDDQSGHMPYQLNTHTDWRRYTAAIMDPVIVYDGTDNQFEDVNAQDKAALAAYMNDAFTARLAKRFTLVDRPAPNALRVKLTLTGAKTSTPFLSTASRFDLVGAPYNLVQTVRGKEGAFTGSVSYAVEIFDASSNALLDGYVAKQYPSPYNLKASLGSLDASKAGLRDGADELAARLR